MDVRSIVRDPWGDNIGLHDENTRVAILATASFSLLASSIVVAVIIYDARFSNSNTSKRSNSFWLLANIPHVYTLPYTLSLASIIQETIYISSQAAIFKLNKCRTLYQLAWTTSWVVAYMLFIVTLVFVCQIYIPSRFIPRKAIWLPFTSGSVLVSLLTLTWLPSELRFKPPVFCAVNPAELIKPWSDIGTTISVLLLSFYSGGAILLSSNIRRSKNNHMQKLQNKVIFHFICYLALGIVNLLFAIPFWIISLFPRSTSTSEVLALVAIHVAGFANSLLFLILRGHRDDDLLGCEPKLWDKRSTWSSFGMSDSAVTKQMLYPVDLERNNSSSKPDPNFSAGSGEQYLNSSATPVAQVQVTEPDSVVSPSPHRRQSSGSAFTYISSDVSRYLQDCDEDPFLPKPLAVRRTYYSTTPKSERRNTVKMNSPAKAYIHSELNISTNSLPNLKPGLQHQRVCLNSNLDQKCSLDSLVLMSSSRCNCGRSRLSTNRLNHPHSHISTSSARLGNSHGRPRNTAHSKDSPKRLHNKSLPPTPAPLIPSDIKSGSTSKSAKHAGLHQSELSASAIPSRAVISTPTPRRAYHPSVSWLS